MPYTWPEFLWDLQTYRWTLLGNTVSVPVAEWVGTALKHLLSHKCMCGWNDSNVMSDGLDNGKKHSLQAQPFCQGCQSCQFVRKKSALLSADGTMDRALISGGSVERMPSSQLIPYKGGLLTELCPSVF